MSKIIFLVQHLGQPRCIKRILAIKHAGFDVEVHGFDRGNYSENINQLTNQGVKVKTIVSSKELFKLKKIQSYAKLVWSVAKQKTNSDIIYAFGFEMATLTRLLTVSKYIYECADVVAAREHSFFFRKIDERNIKKACFTVFTSEGFVDYFFGNKRNAPEIRNRYILLPNKLNDFFLQQERPDVQYITSQKIRFGFVGLFRFLDIYLCFCELIGKEHPNYEFHFWGDSDEKDKERILEYTRKYDNVYLHGTFSNPQDLSIVYRSFDVCVTCYDTKSGNVKIAEPNKLYESIYFNKPIIVSKGTFLGEKVERINVGKAINTSPDDIKTFLDTISVEWLNAIMDNESKIETEYLIDNVDELSKKISSFI